MPVGMDSIRRPDQEAPVIDHTRASSAAGDQDCPPPPPSAIMASPSPFHVQYAAAPDADAAPDRDAAGDQDCPPPPPSAIMASPSPFHVQYAAAPDADAAPDRDSERIALSLLLVTASFALTVTELAAVNHSRFLFDAYTTFVYLTLGMGIGLFISSIYAPEGRRAAQVQKWVTVVGLGCMAAACVLRLYIDPMPMRALTSVWLLSLAGLVIFFSAWNHSPAVVEDACDAV